MEGHSIYKLTTPYPPFRYFKKKKKKKIFIKHVHRLQSKVEHHYNKMVSRGAYENDSEIEQTEYGNVIREKCIKYILGDLF